MNPQVARFIPAKGLEELSGVLPLVPPHLHDKWLRPKPPAETDTTLGKLMKHVRKELIAESGAETGRLTSKVTATTDAIRTGLAKQAGPLGR